MKLLKQAEYMAAAGFYPPPRQSPFARGWVHIRLHKRVTSRCSPEIQDTAWRSHISTVHGHDTARWSRPLVRKLSKSWTGESRKSATITDHCPQRSRSRLIASRRRLVVGYR
jgi:hypothetical protein